MKKLICLFLTCLCICTSCLLVMGEEEIITLNDTNPITINNKEVKINLNGKTIESDICLSIDNQSKVTIIGSGEFNSDGFYDEDTYFDACIKNQGTLIIEDGDYYSDYAVNIINSGNLTINGGRFYVEDWDKNIVNIGGNITINEGEFNSDISSYVPNTSTVFNKPGEDYFYVVLKKHYIKYMDDENLLYEDNVAYYRGNIVNIDLANPSKEGYTFVSWNTKKDGSGINYNNGESITFEGEDIVLYAMWTMNNSKNSDENKTKIHKIVPSTYSK